jgi:hypothetical protein
MLTPSPRPPGIRGHCASSCALPSRAGAASRRVLLRCHHKMARRGARPSLRVLRSRFETQGFVVLEPWLSPSELAVLRAECDAVVAAAAPGQEAAPCTGGGGAPWEARQRGCVFEMPAACGAEHARGAAAFRVRHTALTSRKDAASRHEPHAPRRPRRRCAATRRADCSSARACGVWRPPCCAPHDGAAARPAPLLHRAKTTPHQRSASSTSSSSSSRRTAGPLPPSRGTATAPGATSRRDK